jgi:hypothetical protein
MREATRMKTIEFTIPPDDPAAPTSPDEPIYLNGGFSSRKASRASSIQKSLTRRQIFSCASLPRQTDIKRCTTIEVRSIDGINIQSQLYRFLDQSFVQGKKGKLQKVNPNISQVANVIGLADGRPR